MIYEKLQQARVELQGLQLKKSGKNSYANFEYFELKDFMPSLNGIFQKYKMSSNFSIKFNQAILKIIDFEDGTEAEFTSPVENLELKGCNKIQALGGVHTYMKRYLYLNALEIVENDMFDAVCTQDKNKTLSKNKTPAPIDKNITASKLLMTKLKQSKLTKEEIADFCKMHNLSSKEPEKIKAFLEDAGLNQKIINYIKNH